MRVARVVFGVAVAVAGFSAFFAWLAWYPVIDPTQPPGRSAFDNALVEKGEALAAFGNCVGCHTKAGGEPFAGGLALETPFGAIHSTNITPDPETGIGRWSEAAFRRAMREGIDRQGNFLYPAFPYDHYTKVTDEDVRAIYAYLMTRKAVKAAASANTLSFPFSIRPLVGAWNLLFFKPGVFTPDPSKDEEWNRGAYLVQGLGHCGSCHSPRNFLGAERKDQDLAGAEVDGWHAPALNAASPAPVPWTVDALLNYLIDGWDGQHGIAAGPMTGVVNELSERDEAEIRAMAVYLASLQGSAGSEQQVEEAFNTAKQRDYAPARGAAQAPASGDPALQRGEAVFARACANCHRAGALSATQPAPLGATTPISAPDPRNVIRIVLQGIVPPKGVPERSMPAFRSLSDDELADLLAFMRARFSTRPAWTDVRERIREVRSTRTH
jgi:mono/diheme cytochrome c family protein